jgi:hypothetical protein
MSRTFAIRIRHGEPPLHLAAAAVALAAWSATPDARAQKPATSRTPAAPAEQRRDPAPRSRVFVGTFAVAEGNTTAQLDGESHDEEWEAGLLNFAFALGYDQRISRAYSLGMLGRAGSWNSTWSSAVGYSRWQYDLSLVPRIRFPGRTRRPNTELYVALPFGLTFARIDSPEHRAFSETIGPGVGWNLGPLVGVEMIGKRVGGFVELAVLFRGVSFDADYVPTSPEADPFSVHLRYLTNQMLLGGGVVLAL